MLDNGTDYVIPDFWEIRGYRNFTIRSCKTFKKLTKRLDRFAKWAEENNLRVSHVALDHFPDDDTSNWVWSAIITVEP